MADAADGIHHISINLRMGAAAPNPGHTFPAEGKYAKAGIGVLRSPPMYPTTLLCADINERRTGSLPRGEGGLRSKTDEGLLTTGRG